MGKVILLNKGGNNMDEFDVLDLAKTFLNMESMTHKKLQKMCYYAQAWHLALFDEPLIDNKFEAWIHGPVSPELYQEYKDNGWKPIPKTDSISEKLSPEKIDFIERVYYSYEEFSGDDLEFLTHDELPWQEAREGLSDLEPSNTKISEQTMKEYYSEVFEQNQND
ncbi:MAG: Panacea domain-containing protein [Bacillota bacterium]